MQDTEMTDAESYLDWARRLRESWPAGPWDDEPDEWVGPSDYLSEVATYARRHEHNGHWCGYVHVPPRHPAWGFGIDDVEVLAHWGLTYAGEPFAPVGHRRAWAFGFDCAHFMDLQPGMMAMHAQIAAESSAAARLFGEELRGLGMSLTFQPTGDVEPYERFTPRYRSLTYVRAELGLLLAQLTHKATVPYGRRRDRVVRIPLGDGRVYKTRAHEYPGKRARRVPRGPEPLSVGFVHR